MSVYGYYPGLQGGHDPSGLQQEFRWTEETAKKRLENVIRDWKAAGWKLAPSLLKHFLDKKGPNEYHPTRAEVDEVMNWAPEIFKNRLGQLAEKNGRGQKSIRGYDKHAFSYRKIQSLTNNSQMMLNTYGGLRTELTGTLIKISELSRLVLSKGGVAENWEYWGLASFTDFYTFAPTGKFGLRLQFENYDAANYLETRCDYQPFNHTATKIFSGIIPGPSPLTFQVYTGHLP